MLLCNKEQSGMLHYSNVSQGGTKRKDIVPGWVGNWKMLVTYDFWRRVWKIPIARTVNILSIFYLKSIHIFPNFPQSTRLSFNQAKHTVWLCNGIFRFFCEPAKQSIYKGKKLEKATLSKKPFDGKWVAHVFHRRLIYPRWLLWAFSPILRSLSCKFQQMNNKCLLFWIWCAFCLHMLEALERFSWITITGMLLCSIQKCLSKPTVNPLFRADPHIFSRRNKTVKLTRQWLCLQGLLNQNLHLIR